MHQEREKRRVIVDKRVKTKQVERARRQQQMENSESGGGGSANKLAIKLEDEQPLNVTLIDRAIFVFAGGVSNFYFLIFQSLPEAEEEPNRSRYAGRAP